LAERTNIVLYGHQRAQRNAQVLDRADRRIPRYLARLAEKLTPAPGPKLILRHGVQKFGYLLTEVMVVMVVLVLAINIFLAKPPIEFAAFALALAVGLTPELFCQPLSASHFPTVHSKWPNMGLIGAG